MQQGPCNRTQKAEALKSNDVAEDSKRCLGDRRRARNAKVLKNFESTMHNEGNNMQCGASRSGV